MSPTSFETEVGVWNVQVNGFTLIQAKARLNLNLMDAVAEFPDFMAKLSDDIELFVGLLWITVEEQAMGRGIDEVAFAKQLLGQSFNQASAALVQALADFFQNPQLSEAIQLAIESSKEKRREAEEDSRRALEEVKASLKKQKESQVNGSTKSSSKRRASSASRRKKGRSVS